MAVLAALAALQLWRVEPSHAQTPPKEQEIVVTGQILGTDGPQSKVRVELRPLLSSYERGRTRLAGGKDESAPAAGALTDDGGSFRVLAPSAGMWRLLAHMPGRVPMEYPAVPLTEEMDVPPVELPRDTGLEVKVVGDSGAPIPGAKVLVSQRRVRDAYTPWQPAWGPAERFGITDAKGRLALPALQGEDLTVEVVAPGFQPRSLAVRPARVTVQLSRGTGRRIEVLDTRRRPAGNILVWVEGMGLTAAVSGEDGRLSLTLPVDKRTALRLLAAGGDHLEADVVPRPGSERVRLTLKSPETVSGRVIDILQRGPIAGALVWMGRDYATYVRTDRSGNYVLKTAPGAQRPLRAVASGFFEEVEGPTFALSPKAFLHGSVVDGQGKALAGVDIRVRYDPGAVVQRAGQRLRRSGGLARSRGHGDFRAGGLVPGAAYTLRFATPGFAPQIVKAEAPRTGAPGSPLRVVLTPGKVAFGSVLDENECPVAGAVVELVPPPDSNMSVRLQQIREPDAALRSRAVTDAAGRFEMRGVRAGRFDLAVQARGFAAVRVPGIGIPAQRERFDLGTVVLKPEVLLSGRVQTPEGAPLEGASVRIKPEDPLEEAAFDENATPDAVTDATGGFQLSGRRAGDMLKLVVARAGYATAELSGVAANPEKPLVVILNPASVLAGRVVDEDDEPVTGALLTAVSQRMVVVGGSVLTKGPVFQTRSRDDGSFTIQVEPGPVELTASGPGWQTAVLNLKVLEGKDLEGVEVVLRKAAILTGRVSGSDGAPVVGAEIRRHEPEQPGVFNYYGPWTSTDGDGRYRIDGLAAGPLSAEASHKVFGRAVRGLDLQPGENVVDFQLDGGGEVSGLVVDGLGSPVAGARVRLLAKSRSGQPAQTLSQPDGRFTVQGLSAGTYDVSASKEGLGQTRTPVSVQVGEAAGQEVVLELVRYGVIRGRILGLDAEDLVRVRLSIAWAPAEAAQVSYDGSYRISDVPPGTWRVAAQLPRTGRQAESEVTVDAETGEGRLDLDFRQGLTLSGVVRRNGKPLAGASVAATGKAGAPSWSETDPEGRFSLQGLSHDSYLLEVSDFRTGLFHSREIDLQENQRVLIDLKTGTLSGVVRDARSGEPVPQAEVSVLPATGSLQGRQNTVTGLDGSFSLSELSLGSWSLSVIGPGFQTLKQVVSISGSEAREISLTLQPAQ